MQAEKRHIRGSGDVTGVCEMNISPEKNARRKIGFGSTKSGAGQQFLLKDCKAMARPKGVCFSQTPVGIASL